MFAPEAIESNTWFQDADDLLLSPQDVLDYSFSGNSGDSTSMLSAEAFESFYPLSAAVSNPIQQASSSSSSSTGMDMFSFQEAATSASVPLVQPNLAQNIDQETIRHAAMLRAYLASQHQQEQHPWMVQSLTPMEVIEQAQQKKLQGQQQDQDPVAEQIKQPLTTIQRSDAEILARFLAQAQQPSEREEEEQGAVMEHDTAPVTPVSPPSSPSGSEMGDKSPSVSPTLSRRSLSPETSIESSNTKNAKSSSSPTRQLVCFNCKATQTPLWRRTPDRQHSLCNACGLYFKQYGAHRPLNVRHKLSSVLADVRLNFPYACPPSRGSSRGSSPGAPGSPPRSQDSSSSCDSDSDSGSSSSNTSHHGLVSIPELAKMYARALAPPPPPASSAQRTSPPLMTAKQGIQCVNCSQTQTPLWRKNDAGEPICNACGLYAKLHNRDRPVTMRKSKIVRRRRDWGGNLAHRAQMEAQALANAHAQAQALVLAQTQVQSTVQIKTDASRPSSPSPMAEAETQPSSRAQPQPQSAIAQGLSNNSIMDENKFVDMVGQMSAHQMNRFLSVLESRCGVLRERLLASTEEATAHRTSQSSDLDKLF